jgi:hypothetical protein
VRIATAAGAEHGGAKGNVVQIVDRDVSHGGLLHPIGRGGPCVLPPRPKAAKGRPCVVAPTNEQFDLGERQIAHGLDADPGGVAREVG